MSMISKLRGPLKRFLPVGPQRHLSTTQKCGVASLDLSGIYPPIPTPFKENEDIAWEQLSNNLNKWDKFPFKGMLLQVLCTVTCQFQMHAHGSTYNRPFF